MDRIFIRDLRVETIIGIYDHERETPQTVVLDLDMAADIAKPAASENIEDALTKAGAGFDEVVRVNYVLPDAAEFEQCWPALREKFGNVKPAAMMISAGLADPRMKIEIEVTARKKTGAG